MLLVILSSQLIFEILLDISDRKSWVSWFWTDRILPNNLPNRRSFRVLQVGLFLVCIADGRLSIHVALLSLTFELFFFRGNGASVARIVPYAALHYMAYEEYRRWIILGFPNVEQGPVLDLVAGSIAGGTAVICTYPLDLVRTKLAYQVCPNACCVDHWTGNPHFFCWVLSCLWCILGQTMIFWSD